MSPGATATLVAVAFLALAASVALPAVFPDVRLLQGLPLALAGAALSAPLAAALLRGERWAFVVALAVLLFATDASFRSRNWADKSIDWQVALKGLVWLGCGFAGLVHLGKSLPLLSRTPAALTLGFLLLMALSAAWSPVPSYSLMSALAFLSLFAFALAAARVLDEKGLLLAAALGSGLVVLPSLAIAPFAMGVAATSPGATAEIDRLRGITDHPIPLAEVSALFVFACLALRAHMRVPWARLGLLALALAGVATALLTQSRIPPLAMLAAALAFLAYRKGGLLLMAPVGVAFVTLVLLTETTAGFARVLPEGLLEMVSRSGHSKEILTLSGRLVIWPFALDMADKAPLLGHGHASGMAVFKGFTPWKIVHAHNAYLQAFLYFGIVGLALLAAVLFAQLRAFLREPHPARDIIFLYTLLKGLTEQSMLSNMPSGGVILWMVSVGMAAAASLRGALTRR